VAILQTIATAFFNLFVAIKPLQAFGLLVEPHAETKALFYSKWKHHVPTRTLIYARKTLTDTPQILANISIL